MSDGRPRRLAVPSDGPVRRALAALLLLVVVLAPLQGTVAAQPSTGAAGQAPAGDNRYVLFLAGICMDDPTLFIKVIACGSGPGDFDRAFMDTRDAHERTHTGFAAIRDALAAALGLPADHFVYFSYRATNPRLTAGTTPTDQQINAMADQHGVFRCGFAPSYAPRDTHERASLAACALGAQIRAIRAAHSGAQIDLICHSLGELVAATWLVDYTAPGMPDNDLLPAIHSLVTLDSPLQGVHNLKTDVGKGLSFGIVHWPIAADLSQDFTANRFNSFALGLLTTLPNVLTIANYLDTFVTESDAWIGRYDAGGRWLEDRNTWRDKVIADCAARPLTAFEICHDVVLRNENVLRWVTAWVANPGHDPEAVTTWITWAGAQSAQELAAYAYTTSRAGPAIQDVTFSFQYPAGSGPWTPVTCNGYGTQRIAGSDTSPDGGGLYRCLPGFSPDPGFPGVPSGASVRVDASAVTSSGEFKPHDGPRTITVSNGVPAAPQIRPGGEWSRPADGQAVQAIVHFAAHAYPTHRGEPAIDHVNFTVGWPAPNPARWRVACVALSPASESDLFSCDANLHDLGVRPGAIRVSFDVYDRAGIKNLAPNGVHTLTYAP